MWLKMSSKTQCRKWRHANDDAKWKLLTETSLEQWNCRRVHEIEYAIENTIRYHHENTPTM